MLFGRFLQLTLSAVWTTIPKKKEQQKPAKCSICSKTVYQESVSFFLLKSIIISSIFFYSNENLVVTCRWLRCQYKLKTIWCFLFLKKCTDTIVVLNGVAERQLVVIPTKDPRRLCVQYTQQNISCTIFFSSTKTYNYVNYTYNNPCSLHFRLAQHATRNKMNHQWNEEKTVLYGCL